MPEELDELTHPGFARESAWRVDFPRPRGSRAATHVIFAPRGRSAVGHYRAWLPAKYLASAGLAVTRVASGLTEEDLEWGDVVVTNLCTDGSMLPMIERLHAAGLRVLYDVDDNWETIPRSNASARREVGPEISRHIKECMREADGVTCTTQALVEYYAEKARRVHLCPNTLDLANPAWSTPREARPYTVIGFAGSNSHTEDLVSVAYPLECVCRRFGPERVRLALCGPRNWLSLFDLPPEQLIYIEPVPIIDYPIVLSLFDIGIAPLLPNRFNEFKSPLKLLDYGAMGLPVVASPVRPYHEFAEAHPGVLRLARRPEEWIDDLHALVVSPYECEKLGRALSRCVRAHYDARDGAANWWAAIRSVV
jgi:hypothetical protein